MQSEHKTFNWAADGVSYFGQLWTPEQPRAVIAIIHGMGEHSGRYERTAKRFNQAGLAVISYDQIGHGKTSGKRGHSPDMDTLYRAVMHLLNEAEERFPQLPVFLYGHSMGGNVAANTLLRLKPDIRGAVLSSPWLQLPSPPPSWQVLLGRIMMRLYPSFSDKTRLDPKKISREEAEVKLYIDDDMVHDMITPSMFFPMADAGEWAITQANALKIPVYIMHGTGDQLTSHKASEQFAENAGQQAQLRLWEGGFHELHHDKEKEAVLNEVISWIEEQLKG